MQYRDYGKTGKKVSLLGFGGMRFADVNNHDKCTEMMVHAAKGGVNYFDTAPGYYETRSETVYGKGFAELRKQKLPYYVATKTFQAEENGIRREVEDSLKRLNVEAIDFYHIWCITSLENWKERKKSGIIKTFQKLKEEKLIKHICVSTHLIQNNIAELFTEPVFEGVLFGYSAYNFKTREKAFDVVQQKNLGAVVMNPLGGGLIPNKPELCKFLFERGEECNKENAVKAALQFLWDHKDLSVALVGFATKEEIDLALSAMESYKPRTDEELKAAKSAALKSFEGICTGCSYCDDCPQEIPIPKFMDAYNRKVLGEKDEGLYNQLKWHWNLSPETAGNCTQCGNCESVCTQHLNIIERLEYIKSSSPQ
jgi:predicted aldo/keto reductase-like oxidoreductase